MRSSSYYLSLLAGTAGAGEEAGVALEDAVVAPPEAEGLATGGRFAAAPAGEDGGRALTAAGGRAPTALLLWGGASPPFGPATGLGWGAGRGAGRAAAPAGGGRDAGDAGRVTGLNGLAVAPATVAEVGRTGVDAPAVGDALVPAFVGRMGGRGDCGLTGAGA